MSTVTNRHTDDRRVAVVTGASAGVGRATAVELARRGFDVALLARGEAGLAATAADVGEAGGRALAVPTDVAVWAEVDEAARRAEDELGPVDLWVNNAMTTVFGRSWDCEPEDFRRATEVTYMGQVHGTLAALARMRPRDRGRIINVGSALSYLGIPLQSAYCGAKFACRGFTESVRAELMADGSAVTIGMVHLPAVDTPQFDWCKNLLPRTPQPVAPIYSPELAARTVVDVAIDGRDSKVLGVWNKVVVATARAAPGTAERFAARTAVESQQTDRAADGEQPANLWKPVDADADHGAHGSFGDRSSGMLDPQFLRTLPMTVANLGVAAIGTAAARGGNVVRMLDRLRGAGSIR